MGLGHGYVVDEWRPHGKEQVVVPSVVLTEGQTGTLLGWQLLVVTTSNPPLLPSTLGCTAVVVDEGGKYVSPASGKWRR